MIEITGPELVIQGGTSIEAQLKAQLREHVLTRQLLPGEQLPTVRSLAVGLAIKPSIVERVYQELEQEGLLTSEEGTGIFIADKNRLLEDTQFPTPDSPSSACETMGTGSGHNEKDLETSDARPVPVPIVSQPPSLRQFCRGLIAQADHLGYGVQEVIGELTTLAANFNLRRQS